MEKETKDSWNYRLSELPVYYKKAFEDLESMFVESQSWTPEKFRQYLGEHDFVFQSYKPPTFEKGSLIKNQHLDLEKIFKSNVLVNKNPNISWLPVHWKKRYLSIFPRSVGDFLPSHRILDSEVDSSLYYVTARPYIKFLPNIMGKKYPVEDPHRVIITVFLVNQLENIRKLGFARHDEINSLQDRLRVLKDEQEVIEQKLAVLAKTPDSEEELKYQELYEKLKDLPI